MWDKCFHRNENGAIGVIFGLTAMFLACIAGFALDY